MRGLIFVLLFGTLIACSPSKDENPKPPEQQPVDKPVVPDDDKPSEPAKVIKLTAEEFARLVADYTASEWKYLGDRPAIVDFTATWCQPCANLAMALNNIARDYAGKIQIYSVDFDQQKAVAEAYKVTNLPTMLFISMEGEPTKHVGYRTYAQLKVMVEDELLKTNNK